MRTAAERYWAKVDRKGSDACWPWTAGCNGDGYGGFWDGERQVQAHRFGWELANGSIPDGFSVLHRCDVPACQNPADLFLGTQQDNMDDMYAKGRGRAAKGTAQAAAKLTEGQVRLIREAHGAGRVKQTELADWFRVSRQVISMIVTNQAWTHIALTGDKEKETA